MGEVKLTLPDVLADFIAYYRQQLAWGSLHIVLDDGNVEDSSVRFCQHYATQHGDVEGARLAGLLLQMSRTQRLKLPRRVHAEYMRQAHA